MDPAESAVAQESEAEGNIGTCFYPLQCHEPSCKLHAIDTSFSGAVAKKHDQSKIALVGADCNDGDGQEASEPNDTRYPVHVTLLECHRYA